MIGQEAYKMYICSQNKRVCRLLSTSCFHPTPGVWVLDSMPLPVSELAWHNYTLGNAIPLRVSETRALLLTNRIWQKLWNITLLFMLFHSKVDEDNSKQQSQRLQAAKILPLFLCSML